MHITFGRTFQFQHVSGRLGEHSVHVFVLRKFRYRRTLGRVIIADFPRIVRYFTVFYFGNRVLIAVVVYTIINNYFLGMFFATIMCWKKKWKKIPHTFVLHVQFGPGHYASFGPVRVTGVPTGVGARYVFHRQHAVKCFNLQYNATHKNRTI